MDGGDGVPCANVTKLAAGSDLLVHEAMHREAMAERGVLAASINILATTHTDVSLIGPVARDAKVGALTLHHIVPVDGRTGYPPDLPDRSWTKPVALQYDGPMTMGRDLMQFRLAG